MGSAYGQSAILGPGHDGGRFRGNPSTGGWRKSGGQVCRGAWQGETGSFQEGRIPDIHSWCQAVPSVSPLALALAPG